MHFNRRTLMRGSILAALARPLATPAEQVACASGAVLPVAIASGNGLRATQKAVDLLRSGGDTLDAVIAGANLQEDDAEDTSVGYGGLPNEEGVVELDASVMHGSSRRAGAVASLRGIKYPSRVARLVMERTDHLLLVGEGALRFARAHGFQDQNLLTEKSRLAWLTWKEKLSDRDAWGPGLDAPREAQQESFAFAPDPALLAWAREVALDPPTGTITCLAVDSRGDISGVTTTSGLAFKIPGRVGDSPLIGCGLFVENEVGAAGATGRGEECIKINGAHTVVELMRRGAAPREACLEALRRVVANYNHNRKKLAQFDLSFYAVNKRGQHGAASLWNLDVSRRRKGQYAVNDGGPSRLVHSTYLLER